MAAESGAKCHCYVVRHVDCPVHGQEFDHARVVSNAEVRAFLETLASEPAPVNPSEASRWTHNVAKQFTTGGEVPASNRQEVHGCLSSGS